jgi:host factor-I protein
VDDERYEDDEEAEEPREPEDAEPRGDRRGPPVESTGAEAAYLSENKEARTPMVVCLADGEIVRGWIEYYDRDMVKINRTIGPNLFIRKSQIRYMHEE